MVSADMKVLFIFAHPDDETVACAGTIQQLVEAGHQINLLSVTDGGAGEFPDHLRKAVEKAGGIGSYRQQELKQVCAVLNVSRHKVLKYQDGQINNLMTWGSLVNDLVKEIDRTKPDLIITFDHTGWYYHLDHVGVSIAATLAFHQAKHPTPLLMLSHFRPIKIPSKRWPYAFSPAMPATHVVKVRDVGHKLRALDCHKSQNLKIVCDYVLEGEPHQEFYELAFSRGDGKKMLKMLKLFTPFTA